MNGFRLFLTPSGWFLGVGLFQNIFYNLLIYTNNFCFGYITVSCFFETFPGDWVVGKTNFNENPVVSLDLNLDFGLWLRICQYQFHVSISNFDFQYLRVCRGSSWCTYSILINFRSIISIHWCHSLVLILILISFKTRSDYIFGQKPPTPPHLPPGTQP